MLESFRDLGGWFMQYKQRNALFLSISSVLFLYVLLFGLVSYVFAFDVNGWLSDNGIAGSWGFIGMDVTWDETHQNSSVIAMVSIILVGLAFMWGIRKLIRTVNRS